MDHAQTNMGIRDEVNALKKARSLAAAVELFYENGYDNTTLEAVAEKLGVTKPFIYAHFGSKGEILAEICARGIAHSLEAMDSVLSMKVSQTEKLENLGMRFVKAVLENQKYIAILSREEKNLTKPDFDKINDMRRDFDRKLTKLLKAGVATGEFTVRDPHMAALSIGGMVSWAYIWYRPTGRLSLDAVATEMTDLILAMVKADKTKSKKKS